MTYTSRLTKAAPTMAQIYERTFHMPLRDRLAEVLRAYPDVQSPSWISWEGDRITHIDTSEGLRLLLAVLDERHEDTNRRERP